MKVNNTFSPSTHGDTKYPSFSLGSLGTNGSPPHKTFAPLNNDKLHEQYLNKQWNKAVQVVIKWIPPVRYIQVQRIFRK